MKPHAERRNLLALLAMTAMATAFVVAAIRQQSITIMAPEPHATAMKRKSPDNAYFVLRSARARLQGKRDRIFGEPESEASPEPAGSEPETRRPRRRMGRRALEKSGPIRRRQTPRTLPEPKRTPRTEAVFGPNWASELDDEAFGRLVKDGASLVKSVRKVFDKPYYLCPGLGGPYSPLSETVDFRGLGRLLAASGLKRIRTGQADAEAWAYLYDGMRLGRMIASDGSLSCLARGRQIETMALQHVSEFAVAAVSRDVLASAVDALTELTETPRPRAEVYLQFGWRGLDNSLTNPRFKDVRSSRRRSHRRMMNYARDLRFAWRLGKGQRFIIKHRDHLLSMVSLPYPDYRRWQSNRPEMAKAHHPNYDIVGTLDGLARQYAWAIAQEQGARIVLALELYRRDRGILPPTLDALTPDYVASVPLDPFVEAPFTYRVEGDDYWLYSLGANGADDQGKSADDADVIIHAPAAGVH